MKIINITTLVLILVFLICVVAGPACADVILYQRGTYEDCKIKSVDERYVIVEMKYGEQTFSRRDLLGWFQTEIGKEGDEFFRAGEFLLKRGMRNEANKLFDKAIEINPAYSNQVQVAFANNYATTGSVGSTGTDFPTINISGSVEGTKKTLVCEICGGEGRLGLETEMQTGGKISRTVPCWFCDGKGLKVVTIPNGYRECPTCGGWGYLPGGSTDIGGEIGEGGAITKTRNTEYKEPCWQCSGKGYIPPSEAERTAMEEAKKTMRMAERQTPTPTPTSTEEEEKEEEEEEIEAEEENWFKENSRLLMIGGGVVLLIVIIALSQSSKN